MHKTLGGLFLTVQLKGAFILTFLEMALSWRMTTKSDVYFFPVTRDTTCRIERKRVGKNSYVIHNILARKAVLLKTLYANKP